MFDISLFQQAEEKHFKFQKGMYLSGRSGIQGATIVYSDIVEDFFWNYATRIQIGHDGIAALVDEVEKFLRRKGRVPCFYLTPWAEPNQELRTFLQERGYSSQFRDAWMFFEAAQAEAGERLASPAREQLSIQLVKAPRDVQAFLEVFAKAYGGESMEDEPYGELPAYYVEALRRSIGSTRDVTTFHFVAYAKNERPVAIATLVFEDGWGGIYNVGTTPESRGRGFGTAVSRACIDEWRKLRGQTLFLQTEVGSKVETWYNTMGFATQFVGEGWALVE